MLVYPIEEAASCRGSCSVSYSRGGLFFVGGLLQVLAARHLPKPGRSIASPFVEVELFGHTEEKFKTLVHRKNQELIINVQNVLDQKVKPPDCKVMD